MSDSPRINIVVPDGATTWKDGELDKCIQEQLMPERTVVPLTEEDAFYHMERVQRCNPETYRLLRLVFTDLPEEPELDTVANSIRQYGKGVWHIAGLIELTLGLAVMAPDLVVNWKYPEAFLHPRQECGIADCLLAMDKYLNPSNETEEK